MRSEYEARTRYNLFFYETEDLYEGELNISDIMFFKPVEGIVINGFNLAEKHFGIDIAASNEAMVMAVLDGTVVFSDWTAETGHTIALQHSGNFISVYKHNSQLLKSLGSYVKAGEAIAVSGGSGELSSGPHLHFEIQKNGVPVNPTDYIYY